MTVSRARLAPVAAALAESAGSPDSLLVVAEMLMQMFDADEILWTEIAASGSGTRALTGPTLRADPGLSRQLDAFGLSHPAVQSYLRPGDDGRPRRVSDVSTPQAWAASPAFNEIFRARPGRYQLSLVVTLDAEAGRGWVLERQHRDFDDRDVAAATALLPLLALVHHASPARLGSGAGARLDRDVTSAHDVPVAGLRGEQRGCAALTLRESEILASLAAGSKAAAIGRTHRISESTVRNHLDRIYRKLGVTDRLTAVNEARRRGLVVE